MTIFKKLRTLLLLFILLLVAHYTYQQHVASRSWDLPLEMMIYPINADGASSTKAYIAALQSHDFKPIAKFLQQQASHYHIDTHPLLIVKLAPMIDDLPPPRPGRGSLLSNMLWSLQFRYWAYVHTPSNNSPYTQIRMFVIYHRPEPDVALRHSTGLAKGLLGVVHAFASRQQTSQNNIVIAHEFLHTVGAKDKYNRYGEPIYPLGYANATQQPRYPQQRAEIMGGRIPLTVTTSTMPHSLQQCIVGRETSQEINWLT